MRKMSCLGLFCWVLQNQLTTVEMSLLGEEKLLTLFWASTENFHYDERHYTESMWVLRFLLTENYLHRIV